VKDYFRKGKKYCHDHYESHISIGSRCHSTRRVTGGHKTPGFAFRIPRDGEWRGSR
jgi:hypothetical protein